jgi:hypothetical protein
MTAAALLRAVRLFDFCFSVSDAVAHPLAPSKGGVTMIGGDLL